MDSSENLTKHLKEREECGVLLTKLAVLSGTTIQNLSRIYHLGGEVDNLTLYQLEEINEAISKYLSIIE